MNERLAGLLGMARRAGRLIAGFDAGAVLVNNIPVALLSLLLALGFLFIPDIVFRGAAAVGKCVGALSIIGIVIGAFAHLTGRPVPFFEKADTIMNRGTDMREKPS